MRSRIVDKSALLKFIGSPARPGEAKCFCDSNKRPGQRRIQRQRQTRGLSEATARERLLPAKRPLWHGGTSAGTALPTEAWAKTPQCTAIADGACRRCGGCQAEQPWQARNGSASILNRFGSLRDAPRIDRFCTQCTLKLRV